MDPLSVNGITSLLLRMDNRRMKRFLRHTRVHINIIPAELGSSEMVDLVVEHQKLQAIESAYVVSVGVEDVRTLVHILWAVIQNGETETSSLR